MDVLEELRLTALAWLALAVPVGLCAGGLWLSLGRRLPFPAWQPARAAWTGWDVLTLTVLSLLAPTVTLSVVREVWDAPATPDPVAAAVKAGTAVGLLGTPQGQGPWHAVPVACPAPARDSYDRSLRLALATVLALPLQLLLILGLLGQAHQVGPADLGLHTRHARAAVLVGMLGWLAGAPLVLVLNGVVNGVYQWWVGHSPEPHDLLELVRGRQPLLEWSLLLLTALVVAPLFEELLFRGLLLRWAAVRAGRSHALMLAPVLTVLPLTWLGDGAFPTALTLFLAVLLAGYLALVARPPAPPAEVFAPAGDPLTVVEGESLLLMAQVNEENPAVAALLDPDGVEGTPATEAHAVYATAVVFAVAHPWPTPIPLFFLGLLLARVACRAQSLLAPVTLHFLFNAVACLVLAAGE